MPSVRLDLEQEPLFHLILHKIFPTVLLTTLNHLLHESERQHNKY